MLIRRKRIYPKSIVEIYTHSKIVKDINEFNIMKQKQIYIPFHKKSNCF